MSISVRKLFLSQKLPIALSPVFTLNESSKTIIDSLVVRVVNTAAVSVEVTAEIVSGDTVGKIVSPLAVGAGQFALLQVPVMANGDSLHMSASAADAITIHHQSGLPKTP